MSNTKEVWIEGQMPFNVYEHEDAKGWLGLMNSPSIGIKISYSSSFTVPSEHGGRLTMYYFTISGTEAISYVALEKMVKDFRAVGAIITTWMTKDLDDNGHWFNHLEWEEAQKDLAKI